MFLDTDREDEHRRVTLDPVEHAMVAHSQLPGSYRIRGQLFTTPALAFRVVCQVDPDCLHDGPPPGRLEMGQIGRGARRDSIRNRTGSIPGDDEADRPLIPDRSKPGRNTTSPTTFGSATKATDYAGCPGRRGVRSDMVDTVTGAPTGHQSIPASACQTPPATKRTAGTFPHQPL